MSRARKEKLGRHQLIRGDSQKVLSRYPSKKIDVVVTSPPYNLGVDYQDHHDQQSEEEYLDWLYNICQSIFRVLKDDGSFFLNIAGSASHPWLPFELIVRLRKLFILQNNICWVKSIAIDDITYGHYKPLNSLRYLNHNHEFLFHLTKTGHVPIKRLDIGVPFSDKSNIDRRYHEMDIHCRGNTWFIPYETVTSQEDKFNHPASFPLKIPELCIKTHGFDNKTIVLDPFLGVGTTLIAAEKLGIYGIGIEKSLAYVRATRLRLREMFARRI